MPPSGIQPFRERPGSRFHHLILTPCPNEALVPAPSASNGKGQEDQGHDRIANPPSQGPAQSTAWGRWLQPTKLQPTRAEVSPCSGRDVRFIARPPHRSVRAAFPHTAPASGV